MEWRAVFKFISVFYQISRLSLVWTFDCKLAQTDNIIDHRDASIIEHHSLSFQSSVFKHRVDDPIPDS